jgi:hypothetical protein
MPIIANVDRPKIAWATTSTTEKKLSKSTKNKTLKNWVFPDPGTSQVSNYWAEAIKDRDAQFAEALSKEFAGSEAALRDLVIELMQTNPVIHDGLVWAAQPIGSYAETLKLSERHTTRLIKKLPLRRLVIKREGTKVMHLRWGGEQRHAADDLARIMRNVWKKAGKPKPTPKEYGMLIGLARDWPYPYAPDLFKTVIDNWSVYMSGVKIHIELGKQSGDDYEKDPAKFHQRFLKYPSISVIRRFWTVAPETYAIVAASQDSVPSAIQEVMMSV